MSLPETASSEVVLHAGRLIRPECNDVLEDAFVHVRDGRVVSVGQERPNGQAVIDLSTQTVLPGLIDCHTHLTLPNAFKDFVDELRKSPAQCALEAIPNLRMKLLSGFTTVREAGSYWALVDVAVRDAIASGLIVGPRMLAPGAMITMSGGAGAMTGLAPEIELPLYLRFGKADSPAQIRERIRTVINYGADVIKVFASGAVMQHGCGCPTGVEFTCEELNAAVDEANGLGRRVMAHAHSPKGIMNALKAGVASIEHGTMLDEECALLMRERGTYLVPTLSVWDSFDAGNDRPEDFLAKSRMIGKSHDEAFRTALRLGVKIALGSDSVVCPHDKGARELHHMVRLGMSPIAAIRAATVDAADLIDLPDVGAVAPGMRADIIAVDGDPLANIDLLDQVSFVMKDGAIYKNEAA